MAAALQRLVATNAEAEPGPASLRLGQGVWEVRPFESNISSLCCVAYVTAACLVADLFGLGTVRDYNSNARSIRRRRDSKSTWCARLPSPTYVVLQVRASACLKREGGVPSN